MAVSRSESTGSQHHCPFPYRICQREQAAVPVKKFLEKRQESYENILSETGIKYRINRSIQVEGAFGVLKNDYGFQRFLLRGKTKVKLEILLLCLGLTSINYMKKYKKNGQEVICLQ